MQPSYGKRDLRSLTIIVISGERVELQVYPHQLEENSQGRVDYGREISSAGAPGTTVNYKLVTMISQSNRQTYRWTGRRTSVLARQARPVRRQPLNSPLPSLEATQVSALKGVLAVPASIRPKASGRPDVQRWQRRRRDVTCPSS